MCEKTATRGLEGKGKLASFRTWMVALVAIIIVLMVIPVLSQHRIYVTINQDKISDVSIQTLSVPWISTVIPSSTKKGTGVYTIEILIQQIQYNTSFINVPIGQYTFLAENVTQGVPYNITVLLIRNNIIVDNFTIFLAF